MKSRTTERFRREFGRLPREVQEQARAAYRLFQQNPHHPSLHFHRIQRIEAVYSARVGRNYRAVGTLEDDLVVWFWIGTHADYDRLIENL